MAISTGYIIAPMLTAFKVIVLFLACMTLQTYFGDLLGRLIQEGSNLGLITASLNVGFAWAVAGFATLLFRLPAGFCQCGVNGF